MDVRGFDRARYDLLVFPGEGTASNRVQRGCKRELRRHAADAIARSKPRGWKIDAPDRSSNVDGIVALMMALDRIENQPEPVKLLGWL
jgi:hypothetical protein